MPDTKEQDIQTRANEGGKSRAESMRDMLAALAHAQECDGTDAETGEDCQAGQDTTTRTREDGTTYEQHNHENPEAWHDEDAARAAIEEYPLEVAADKGERFDGTRHYVILLGTGGPADRITGELDQYGQPDQAYYQFQDWFEPWTSAQLSSDDEDTVLGFAQFFSFPEAGEE